jgi:hypothetical protein
MSHSADLINLLAASWTSHIFEYLLTARSRKRMAAWWFTYRNEASSVLITNRDTVIWIQTFRAAVRQEKTSRTQRKFNDSNRPDDSAQRKQGICMHDDQIRHGHVNGTTNLNCWLAGSWDSKLLHIVLPPYCKCSRLQMSARAVGMAARFAPYRPQFEPGRGGFVARRWHT